MKRDLYSELIRWKNSKNRKPLILMGAGQVGKTHLLKCFGKQEYASLIYLNFESDPQLNGFFSQDLNPVRILENLSLYLNQEIHPEETLLIFDEIQESPLALNALKYFYEQLETYHIAAAGSLLGVKLAHTKGFPAGKVNFLDLYPLSFFEFLDALGKNKLKKFLLNLKSCEPISEPIHQELIQCLNKYLLIGGMPEAVSTYVRTGNLPETRKIQKEILDAYLLDFAKHAPKEQLSKITQVWESIPSQLAKENKKFIFAAIKKSARGREYEDAIQWLSDAGLIYKSYHISSPKFPLKGFSDQQVFKVFLLDVGLLAAMSQVPLQVLVEENRLFFEFRGAFTENFVGQALVSVQQSLHYWTSEGIAEIDFIVENGQTILPLEVKAGISKKKKSLIVYGEKYQPDVLLRATLMNLKRDGKVLNLPLYLVTQWPVLITYSGERNA